VDVLGGTTESLSKHLVDAGLSGSRVECDEISCTGIYGICTLSLCQIQLHHQLATHAVPCCGACAGATKAKSLLSHQLPLDSASHPLLRQTVMGLVVVESDAGLAAASSSAAALQALQQQQPHSRQQVDSLRATLLKVLWGALVVQQSHCMPALCCTERCSCNSTKTLDGTGGSCNVPHAHGPCRHAWRQFHLLADVPRFQPSSARRFV
jgi:hypothetical protein